MIEASNHYRKKISTLTITNETFMKIDIKCKKKISNSLDSISAQCNNLKLVKVSDK